MKKTQYWLDVSKVIEPDFSARPILPPLVVISKESSSHLPPNVLAKIEAKRPAGVRLDENQVAVAYHPYGSRIRALVGTNIPFVWEEPTDSSGSVPGRLVYMPLSSNYEPDPRTTVEYRSAKHRLVFYEGKLALCISLNGNHESQVNVRIISIEDDLNNSVSLGIGLNSNRKDPQFSSPTISSLRYAIPKSEDSSTHSPTKPKKTSGPSPSVASSSSDGNTNPLSSRAQILTTAPVWNDTRGQKPSPAASPVPPTAPSSEESQRLDELESQVSMLISEMKALKHQNGVLTSEMEALKHQNGVLTSEVKALDHYLKDLKNRLKSL